MDNVKMTGAELVAAGLAFRTAVAVLYNNQLGLLGADGERELKLRNDPAFHMKDTGAAEKERNKQERLLKMVDRAIEHAKRIERTEQVIAESAVKALETPKSIKKTHGLVTA